MTKGFIGTILFSLLFFHSFAQKKTSASAQKGAPITADCKYAIQLGSTRKVTYGPTIPPKGFGKILDIKACDKQDIFTFEKEHNSAWYYFTAYDDGDVIFEITSVDNKNDYDFMLFKWTDSCFCEDVKYGYLLPSRTNLSRSGKGGVPMTGLSAQTQEEHVSTGEGEPFSRSLPVKKGEKYYFALDNVYPKGDGHFVKIYYLKTITIGGTVMDENKKPVAATVSVEDKNGKLISSTKCNSTGDYLFNAKIVDDEFYTLVYSSDSSFMSCRQIALSDFSKTSYENKELKTTLPKLVRGKKYMLNAISFHEKTTRLQPPSYPSLNSLCKLMQKDTTLIIQIEGHVNNALAPSNSGSDKILGQKKASEIYNYLLSKGIADKRMKATSYGSLYMLYPQPSSSEEIEANNRVEIFIMPENNK